MGYILCDAPTTAWSWVEFTGSNLAYYSPLVPYSISLYRCRLCQWFMMHSFYAHRLNDSFNVRTCVVCLGLFEWWQSVVLTLLPIAQHPRPQTVFSKQFVATSISLVTWSFHFLWCFHHVCSGKAYIGLVGSKGLFARCCPRWLHCCTSVPASETVWEEDGHKLCVMQSLQGDHSTAHVL